MGRECVAASNGARVCPRLSICWLRWLRLIAVVLYPKVQHRIFFMGVLRHLEKSKPT